MQKEWSEEDKRKAQYGYGYSYGRSEEEEEERKRRRMQMGCSAHSEEEEKRKEQSSCAMGSLFFLREADIQCACIGQYLWIGGAIYAMYLALRKGKGAITSHFILALIFGPLYIPWAALP